MKLLRQNTAVIITVGPFYDKTDGVTIEPSLTITNERITLTADTDDGSAPTNILDNITGATSGTANDLNYITDNDAGMMKLELAAADVNRVGRMLLSINDAANHVPVFHDIFVLSQPIYDWLTGVTALLPVEATLAASQPATTHAAMTITGALTVSNGIDVSASTTNRAGLAIAGNGTAPGMYVAGGDTGDGIRAESGISGSGKSGISGVGHGTGGIGIKATGAGGGPGLSGIGGDDGVGILATGGATSGAGILAQASGGGNGLEAAGTGAGGHGISAHAGGGASAHGILAASGSGGVGHGIHAVGLATSSAGLSLQGAGGINNDLLLNTPATNLDDPILAILGTPADTSISVDIAALPTAAENLAALWAEALPGSYGAGTAGELLGNIATAAEVAAATTDAVLDEAAADHVVAGSVGALLGDIPTAAENTTAVMAAVVEPSISAGVGLTNDTGTQLTALNVKQALALIASALSGVLAGAATTTVTTKQTGKPAGNTRITATVDADGNRSALTLKVPD